MKNNGVVKRKCHYCGGCFDETTTQCPQCGSMEFDEEILTFDVNDQDKTKTKTTESRGFGYYLKVTMILIALAPLVLFVLIFIIALISVIIERSSGSSLGESEYVEAEYSYSSELLENEDLCIGKTSNSSAKDYHNSVKITGKFDDLYENIYQNIYSTQFNNFNYKLPCDIELKHNDVTLNITSFDISYYNSLYVAELNYSLSGQFTEDISLFLEDSNGNRVRLLVGDYYHEEYKNLREFINDSYIHYKELSVDGPLTKYDKAIINIGTSMYEYKLDYENAFGEITYYKLK